jgi:hypothetical protein
MVHVPGDHDKLGLLASCVFDHSFPRQTLNTTLVKDEHSMVVTSTSRVLARGPRTQLGFLRDFVCVSGAATHTHTHTLTAVQTRKRLSARISSVVWNTGRLLIHDWYAVCKAGLLNTKAVSPSSKASQVSRGRDTYTDVRDGTGIWLRDAAASRLVSVRCVTFGRSIVRVVEGFLRAIPRGHACSCGCMRFPSHGFLLAPISSSFHSEASDWV